MGKRIRTALNCILAAALILGLIMSARGLADKASAEDSYEEALRIATASMPAETSLPPETLPPGTLPPETEPPAETELPVSWVPAPVEDDPEMKQLESINLAALRLTNPDVIGWIRIPGTWINYPLLQGEDNEYYLNHTWQGYRNTAGAAFMDYLCATDFTDFNTLLYGHNMADGSMFSGITKYQEGSYIQDNPYIYLVTDTGIFRYEVFAAYPTETGSPAYSLKMQQPETKEYFLSAALEASETDTGIRPAVTDRILTLSTCFGPVPTQRFVVHARLVMVAEQIT